MGLFDMFKKSEPAKPAAPASIAAEGRDGELCAPISGRVCAMTDVPDPVFSGEVLGKGCAIWPSTETVYAPVSGTVTVVMGHAVGLKSEDGTEVLVHVGVDTVNMNGEGFTGYVEQGDHVVAGQPILGFDSEKIKAAGHPDCVVLAVSNTADFASVEMIAATESTVEAGKPVVKVTR